MTSAGGPLGELGQVVDAAGNVIGKVVDTAAGAVGGLAGGAIGGAVGGATGAAVGSGIGVQRDPTIGTTANASVTPGTSTLDKRVLQGVSIVIALLALLDPGLHLDGAAQAAIVSTCAAVIGVIEGVHALLARR